MGQKRTQNIMDEKIGVYLADFEKRLLDKIDGQLTERLDTLEANEEDFTLSVKKLRLAIDNLERRLSQFSGEVTLKVVGWSFLSAMIGGFTTFLLLWYFW